MELKNGKIITITSGKGGVGKSTTTANFVTALSENGFKVIAIDLDIGLRNLDMLLGLENRIVYNIVDIMEGNCNLSQAIIKDKKTDNLYFIPASQTKNKNILSKSKLKNILVELKKQFDYIVIDSPAGIEGGFEHSIFMTDLALIITTPEISAIRDADRVINLIDKNVPKYLIINKLKPKFVQNGSMLSVDDVVDLLRIELVGILPDDEDIVVSTNLGEPVFFKKNSIFRKIYTNIVNRVIFKQKIPFEKLEEASFLDKIKKIIGV